MGVTDGRLWGRQTRLVQSSRSFPRIRLRRFSTSRTLVVTSRSPVKDLGRPGRSLTPSLLSVTGPHSPPSPMTRESKPETEVLREGLTSTEESEEVGPRPRPYWRLHGPQVGPSHLLLFVHNHLFFSRTHGYLRRTPTPRCHFRPPICPHRTDPVTRRPPHFVVPSHPPFCSTPVVTVRDE